MEFPGTDAFRIEVINTGTELLLGKMMNAHLAFMGRELFKIGLTIERQTAVHDGEDIKLVLGEVLERSHVVILTGGLGPTSDDVTREMVADFFGLELELDRAVLEAVKARFKKLGKEMPKNNKRQAMVPKGARLLPNAYGNAPGIFFDNIDHRGKKIFLFLLPGPSQEFRPMFLNHVLPQVRVLTKVKLKQREFKFYGIGEPELAEILEPQLKELDGMQYGFTINFDEVDVRCIGQPEQLDQIEKLIEGMFADKLVSSDGSSLAEIVISLLQQEKQTISTAESCTGGFLASRLTDVSGASEVFIHGGVTYSNMSKINFLSVPKEIIERNGAISEEAAAAMAEGCLKVVGTSHVLAVTGVAGPRGGGVNLPVGTAFVALASEGEKVYVEKVYYRTERKEFKQAVSQAALNILRRRLLGYI